MNFTIQLQACSYLNIITIWCLARSSWFSIVLMRWYPTKHSYTGWQKKNCTQETCSQSVKIEDTTLKIWHSKAKYYVSVVLSFQLKTLTHTVMITILLKPMFSPMFRTSKTSTWEKTVITAFLVNTSLLK